MTRSLITVLGAALLCGGTYAQGSDSCSTAQPISGCGLFAFDNTLATQDGLPDFACLKFGTSQIDLDVWFSWTAMDAGNYSFATCGLTGVDTKMAVYADTGACPPSPALDCDDDDDCIFVGGGSKVNVTGAAMGSSYLIRLGTFPGAAGGTGQLEVSGCPTSIGSNYCTSTPNSFSATGASISAMGSLSISGNDLTLIASDVPQLPGIGIFIGSKAGQNMFALYDGFLCVAAPVIRINTVTPPVGNVVTQVVSIGPAPISAMVGDDLWFQHWFRDPNAGGNGANFTDGIELLGVMP